jgi:MoaA/NifB/PqqE/SkfB family radical SAM enzyme
MKYIPLKKIFKIIPFFLDSKTTRRKKIFQKYGDKFCAAPFTSVYEGQFGKISTCCYTGEPLGFTNENSIEEILNNKQSNEIRKSFLENKFPSQCKNCENFENSTGKISDIRKASIDLVPFKMIERAVDLTHSNGAMEEQSPVWLDLLWTNKCNFACLGCNSELSSTIALKYIDAYALAHNVNPSSMSQTLWKNDNKSRIEYILKHQNTIKLLHLNGGEPFIQEGVHDLLETLIDHGLHKKISIWTHTNGSIKKYKGKDIIDDYLSKWETECQVSLSHDGYGSRGEYVRYGMKEKKWLETYKRLQTAGVDIKIQTCYNVFNALNLFRLYEWYLENTDNKTIKSMTIWNNPLPFTAKFLQYDSVLLSKANKELDLLEKENLQSWDWKIDHLRSFLNSKVDQTDLIQATESFKNSINKFDELRKTNFTKTFPELLSLYSN